jgi:hypothetical protein
MLPCHHSTQFVFDGDNAPATTAAASFSTSEAASVTSIQAKKKRHGRTLGSSAYHQTIVCGLLAKRLDTTMHTWP